jgi:hypothetical protein
VVRELPIRRLPLCGLDDQGDVGVHLAAIVFGAQALMHYREMIDRGLLSAELDDMPKYSG